MREMVREARGGVGRSEAMAQYRFRFERRQAAG